MIKMVFMPAECRRLKDIRAKEPEIVGQFLMDNPNYTPTLVKINHEPPDATKKECNTMLMAYRIWLVGRGYAEVEPTYPRPPVDPRPYTPEPTPTPPEFIVPPDNGNGNGNGNGNDSEAKKLPILLLGGIGILAGIAYIIGDKK